MNATQTVKALILSSAGMAALCLTNTAFAQAVTGGSGTITTGVCQQNNITFFTSIACGDGATTTRVTTNPDGTTTTQNGLVSTAIGSNAEASGNESTAVGRDVLATGTRATAVGAFASAEGRQTTSIGAFGSAIGNFGTSIGSNTSVTADAVNSVALGSGSIANIANTVSVGSARNQRQIVNMAAGAVTATSTDAINGSQLFATNARISALEALNLNTSSQIAGLQSGLNSLEDQLTLNNRQMSGGIAAALALGGAAIVPDSNVSMSFNLATYRGQQGFSGSVIGRVSEKVYISGGVAGSTVKGSTGGRVGVTFGF